MTTDGAILNSLNQKPADSDSFAAFINKPHKDAIDMIKYLKDFDFGADKDELILKLFKAESLNTNLKLKLSRADALITELVEKLDNFETPPS